MQLAIDRGMNIFLPIGPEAIGAPNPQVSDSQAPSPQQDGVFNLMICQLMQGIVNVTMPVQSELRDVAQAVQSKESVATTLPVEIDSQKTSTISPPALLETVVSTPPTDVAGQEMVSIPPSASLETVQSAFAAALRELPKGLASSGGDTAPASDQTVQSKESVAATLPVDIDSQETATISPPASLQGIQSAFVTAIRDMLSEISSERDALTNGLIGQTQKAPEEADPSSHSDSFHPDSSYPGLTASGDEGLDVALSSKADNAMTGRQSAEPVQMPADAVKKAPATEVEQPLIMREVIVSESDREDAADPNDPQQRTEAITLPETRSLPMPGSHGITSLHTEHAESSGAVSNAHDVSEGMRVEGNRFVITRLDGTSIEISLQPEGLGKLDIGLMLDKGVVNAQIQASNAAGKELIERNMHDIVTALAQEGITIGGFSVSLKDDRNDLSWSQGERQRQQAQGEPVITRDYTSAPRQLISQGKVNIFI